MTEWIVRAIDAELSSQLRRSVLRPGLAAGSPMPGDDQPGVVHLGAFDGSSLVSTCLIFPESCPWLPELTAWRLRSMATDPGLRGTGAGTAVLTEAAGIARSAGAELLWCLARETAVGFYQRNGWQPHGELFDTDLGPHLRMWRVLADQRN